MSAITTHVLDVSRGKPAAGIQVVLERQAAGSWSRLGAGVTDADGRKRDLLAEKLTAGVYRLTFETGAYFAVQKVKTFYPSVSIVFEIEAAQEHHHVPLLVSPFGYSTYRGS